MLGRVTEREIAEQPDTLASNAPQYSHYFQERFSGRSFDLVLLAARGSSDNAALYARYLVEIHLGIPVSLAAPSVWSVYGRSIRYPRCLAIGISQSGAAADVAAVLGNMRAAGHTTLAITNTLESVVANAAEFVLELGVGPESAVAATKTYTASLLAVYQLVRALAPSAELPEPILPDSSWLQRCSDEAQVSAAAAVTAAERRDGGPEGSCIFSLGRGYSFSTANETALKLIECALMPCIPLSTADFQHGPKVLAGPGSAAIVYGEVPAGLADRGCTAIRPPETPQTPDVPIREAIFAQWLALHAARYRGIEPDQPTGLSKVTITR